ncbi:DUF421 domain-containing protein [Mesonia maritima]|uniref:Uncharacterized membrane protein YcaP (DUF421 family) n=1 Tax=Mesonia maritima TaxID=1793873 RepID=A0ABU1K9H5_9FLAO|nr:YetF domain-containing protein [Mesonia maritima]MDR6302251.1 uncharacterized membrane protein YcaP (DUF421 family) [Mesonia maritima]
MIQKLFSISTETFLFIIFCSVGIYFGIILFTKIAGKRSFSKMSSFDFAMTVAIGSLFASVILSSTINLTEGLLGLAMLYILQMLIAILRRFKVVQSVVDNKPLLLMDGEKILDDNLRKARVAESDLRAKLREANVIELSEIKAVIFETTGDISVLHTADDSKKVNDFLLKDVKK